MTPRFAALVLLAAVPALASNKASPGAGQARPWASFVTRVSATPQGAELAKALNLNFTVPGSAAQGSFIAVMERLGASLGYTPEHLPPTVSSQRASIQTALTAYARAAALEARGAQGAKALSATWADLSLLKRVEPALDSESQVLLARERQTLAQRLDEEAREEIEAKILLAVKSWDKGGLAAINAAVSRGPAAAVSADQAPDADKAAFLSQHRLAKNGAADAALGPLAGEVARLRAQGRGEPGDWEAADERDLAAKAIRLIENSPDAGPEKTTDALFAYMSALHELGLLSAAPRRTTTGFEFRSFTGFAFDHVTGQSLAEEPSQRALAGAYTRLVDRLVQSSNARGLGYGHQLSGEEESRLLAAIPELAYTYKARDAVIELRAVSAFFDDLVRRGFLRREQARLEESGGKILGLYFTDSSGQRHSYKPGPGSRGFRPEAAAQKSDESLIAGLGLRKPQERTPEGALEDFLRELLALYPRGREIPGPKKNALFKEAGRRATINAERPSQREVDAVGRFLAALQSPDFGWLRPGSIQHDAKRGLFYTTSDGRSLLWDASARDFSPANRASPAVLAENAADFLARPATVTKDETLLLAVRADSRVLFIGVSAQGLGGSQTSAVVELSRRKDGVVLDSRVQSGTLSQQAWRDLLQAVDRQNEARKGMAVGHDLALALRIAQKMRSPFQNFTTLPTTGKTAADAYVNRRTGEFIAWANTAQPYNPDVTEIHPVYARTGEILEYGFPGEASQFYSASLPLTARAKANLEAAFQQVNGIARAGR